MSKKDIHTGSHAHENQKGNTIDGKHIIDNRTDISSNLSAENE